MALSDTHTAASTVGLIFAKSYTCAYSVQPWVFFKNYDVSQYINEEVICGKHSYKWELTNFSLNVHQLFH